MGNRDVRAMCSSLGSIEARRSEENVSTDTHTKDTERLRGIKCIPLEAAGTASHVVQV